MPSIFTFCIYGDKPKYCEGLIRNLTQIAELWPDFETWITVGADVPASYVTRYKEFPRTRIFQSPHTGPRLMAHRFFHIDNGAVDVMFVRDADSRFGPRDIWCIRRFLEQPSYKVFTIRDHPNHVFSILGGQWGMRRIEGFSIRAAYRVFCAAGGPIDEYYADQKFLHEHIYKAFRTVMIAYVSDNVIEGDSYEVIPLPNRDKWDYCGSVYEITGTTGEYPVYSLDGDVATPSSHPSSGL